MRCTLGFNSEMLKWKDEFVDWFIRRARTESQYYARLDPVSADWSRNQNIVKLRNSTDVILNNSLKEYRGLPDYTVQSILRKGVF